MRLSDEHIGEETSYVTESARSPRVSALDARGGDGRHGDASRASTATRARDCNVRSGMHRRGCASRLVARRPRARDPSTRLAPSSRRRRIRAGARRRATTSTAPRASVNGCTFDLPTAENPANDLNFCPGVGGGARCPDSKPSRCAPGCEDRGTCNAGLGRCDARAACTATRRARPARTFRRLRNPSRRPAAVLQRLLRSRRVRRRFLPMPPRLFRVRLRRLPRRRRRAQTRAGHPLARSPSPAKARVHLPRATNTSTLASSTARRTSTFSSGGASMPNRANRAARLVIRGVRDLFLVHVTPRLIAGGRG